MDFDDVLILCGVLLVGFGIYQFSPGLAAIVMGATCILLGCCKGKADEGKQR